MQKLIIFSTLLLCTINNFSAEKKVDPLYPYIPTVFMRDPYGIVRQDFDACHHNALVSNHQKIKTALQDLENGKPRLDAGYYLLEMHLEVNTYIYHSRQTVKENCHCWRNGKLVVYGNMPEIICANYSELTEETLMTLKKQIINQHEETLMTLMTLKKQMHNQYRANNLIDACNAEISAINKEIAWRQVKDIGTDCCKFGLPLLAVFGCLASF